jgi:hypothetical protein
VLAVAGRKYLNLIERYALSVWKLRLKSVQNLPYFGLYTFVLCMRLFSAIGLNRTALKTMDLAIAMKTLENRTIAFAYNKLRVCCGKNSNFVHLLRVCCERKPKIVAISGGFLQW